MENTVLSPCNPCLKNQIELFLYIKLLINTMAKFDKIAVLNKIGSTGMVPVFYHKDAEVAKK